MAENEHFTNGRTGTFATGFGLVGISFGAQITGWSHWLSIGAGYGSGFVLMLLSAIWITKSYFSRQPRKVVTDSPQASGMIPGIPTVSALLGQTSNVNFDARQFFALAHYSPITAEIEKNIKIVAQQNSPDNVEAFYARFIGVGLVAYQHDISSLTIFGSQLRAMEEMNSRGPIPKSDLRKHYNKAVIDYPKTFYNYAFEEWLDYLKMRMLIVAHPSQMVELSFNGRDFLKYLAHIGKNTAGLIN